MSLASAAWGCWWLDLVLIRFVPDLVPRIGVVATVAGGLAAAGLAVALFTLRGSSRLWLGLSLIPLLANLSLLFVPWLIDEAGLREALSRGAG